MKNKSNYRSTIDSIDEQIMKLLNERFNVVKEIGFIKTKNNQPLTDYNRELQVLQKANNFTNKDNIKSIYEHIISISKDIQTSSYFLVGKSLNHSFSKIIHNLLGNNNYELYETEQFDEIKNIPFKAINVTNPYKQDAFKMCDVLSPIALRTKAVNTIINVDNKMYGYNTDYLGFIEMIMYYNITLANKKIAIIGNGGTKNTIQLALENFGPSSIKVFARHPNLGEEPFVNIVEYNPNIIVNITSYNVYPHFELQPLIDITNIKALDTIIDLNYNPLRGVIGLNKNIKYYNGLYMLVSQAEYTEILIDQQLKRERISPNITKIVDYLTFKMQNLIIIGMPLAGKTTLAKHLGKEFKMPVYDTDELLEKENHSLTTLLTNNETEETFRKYESNIVNKLSTNTSSIISLGGGTIKNSNNMTILAQNGIIIYLDVSLKTLISRNDGSRPLASNNEKLEKLYKERKSMYEKYADLTITSENIDEITKSIKEFIKYDNFNN